MGEEGYLGAGSRGIPRSHCSSDGRNYARADASVALCCLLHRVPMHMHPGKPEKTSSKRLMFGRNRPAFSKFVKRYGIFG